MSNSLTRPCLLAPHIGKSHALSPYHVTYNSKRTGEQVTLCLDSRANVTQARGCFTYSSGGGCLLLSDAEPQTTINPQVIEKMLESIMSTDEATSK